MPLTDTDPALTVLAGATPRRIPYSAARFSGGCDHMLMPTYEGGEAVFCLNCDPTSYCHALDCPGVPRYGDAIGCWWCEQHKLLAVLMTLLEETHYPPLMIAPGRVMKAEVDWYLYLTQEQPDRLTVFALLPQIAAAKLHSLEQRSALQTLREEG